jgi:hypothetical protein
MRLPRLLAIGAVLALVPASHLPAQETKAQRDPDFPTEQHKRLNVLVGSWDVVIRYRAGPGKEADGKAQCETAWVLDRHALRQEYKSDFNGRPLTVLQMLGYNSRKQKFFEFKLDSMDTGALFNEGASSDDGKVITLEGERTDPATGKTGKLRTVTTIEDPDHYTLEWFLIDADGKAEKGVTLKHTRSK